MVKGKGRATDHSTLRGKAEERLKGRDPSELLLHEVADAKSLLHELQVHQIELEMQNEELRRARDEAERALNEYTDLYDFAPVSYFTVDWEGVIRNTNLTGTAPLGLERSYLVGRPFSSLVHADMRRLFDLFLRKALESAVRETDEVMLLRKGSQPFWARVEAKAPESAQECRMAVFDITEGKHIENTLLFLLEHGWSGEDFFKSLARYLAETLDMDYACIGRLQEDCLSARTLAVYSNGKFEDSVTYNLKDRPSGDVVGKVVCIFPEGVRHLFPQDALLQKMAAESYVGITLWSATGQPIGLIAMIGRKPPADPRPAQAMLKLAAVRAAGELERRDAEDEIRKARDGLEFRVQERTAELEAALERLTEETAERRRIEEELFESRKMEAIGTFAGGIAHDFNNILGSIIGFAELIEEEMVPGSPVHRNIEYVLKASIKGRELVKQILTLSRRAKHEMHPLALSTVVHEVIKLVQPLLPPTLTVKTHIEAGEGAILGDSVQMHQVVMNLYTNAAYAMRENGGTLEIGLDEDPPPADPSAREPLIRPGRYVHLSVRDTGCGMGVGVLEKVFEPFFTTKAAGEGTGLGLSIVHGIVKGHGGFIRVDTEQGKGSTFHVYMPRLQKESHSAPIKAGPLPRGKEHILFVDDEESMTKMGRARLTELGYTVTASTSGTEALEIFRSNPDIFDLVVTDYMMPDVTGTDLAVELLKIRSDLPIILTTGNASAVSREDAVKAGVSDILMKPYTKQEIAKTVRQALDRESQP